MESDRARCDGAVRCDESERSDAVVRCDGGPHRGSPVCRSCGAALDRADRYCPQCGTERRSHRGRPRSAVEDVARNVQDLLYGVLGWVFVLTALGTAVRALQVGLGGSLAAGAFLLLLATFLAGFGVVLNPRFGRQIARRHAPTTVGRTRTVDHRVVRPGERCFEPCTVCGEGFDAGLVRRRRDEFVLAGLPAWTFELGYNHYCADCAQARVFGSDGLDRDAIDAATFSDELDVADATGAAGGGAVGDGSSDAAGDDPDGTDREPTDRERDLVD